MSERPPSRIHVSWDGEQRFTAGKPGESTLLMDGTSTAAQSPPDALLSALGGCTGIDAVEILAKRRTPVSRFEIEIEGERVDSVPRRFTHIRLTYTIEGAGIEREHAERALDLSITKYCTVRDSLRQDITIEWTLVLNGAATGEWRAG